MKYFGLLLFSLLIIGCQDHPEKNNVFFGGEIINPKSNLVLLMQQDQIIDSLTIKPDNTFGASISNIKPGLYYFKHAYEFQYLYLEPKDSISIRLNTWDFDETLVFDGVGSEKNELLLDLFLINEKEADIFYTYFSLDEVSFENKINEALKRHASYLDQLEETNKKLSSNFLHLAKGAIDYPIYRLKELYPFYHKKRVQKDRIFKLSKDYYSFRNQVDLNDSLLAGYYAYQNYISAYLYNVALQKSKDNKFDTQFRDTLLSLITEKIQLPQLKNRLIYQEVVNMLFSGSCKVEENQLNTFFANSTDSTAVAAIKNIIEAKNHLKIGSKFSKFDVVSSQKDTLNLKEVIENKFTVIYFLPPTFKSTISFDKRIAFLSNKYPDLNFVGIHANKNTMHPKYKHQKANQYYFIGNADTSYYFSKKYPRTILINKKGVVVNNYTLLSNKYIEKQLQELVNSSSKKQS